MTDVSIMILDERYANTLSLHLHTKLVYYP